jgi:serine/threonine protein kinase
MVDNNLVHPGAERLSAFGLGQLDSAEAAEVERHVKACTVCCQTLWSLPDDRLVSLLRQAFSKLPVLEATSVLPSATPQGPELPPELAEHPRYRIVEVLGQGGMGTVYKAQHRLMERLVALKVIDRSLTGNPAVVERFRREVKAAAQLNHPNIVHAYDAEQAMDTHFLVMEFVEGTTLSSLVEQQGPLPVAQACDYIRQAAVGLQRAFEHGMIHRDIKPHNLMRTPLGVVKILDFGLARLLSETNSPLSSLAKEAVSVDVSPANLTQMGMVMGTADYMAPEQAIDAHAADICADIYSLGCTLYYLLSGQAPFPEGTVLDKLRAHRTRKPRPLSDFRKDVPPALVRILERMMAKDPDQRYQTPAEAADALMPFTSARAPRRWSRKRRWAASLLTAATIAAASAIITVATDKGEFVLQTDDPNISVQLDKAGVKIHDRGSNREYLLKVGKQHLPSGEYDIDVKELPANIEISGSTFRLKRGDTVSFTAHVRRSAQERADKLVQRAEPVQRSEAGKFLKTFGPKDKPLSQDDITADQGGWRITAKEGRTVRLFEIANPGIEECMVVFEARLKTQRVRDKAYLEMWCRFPDKGEFFSKDIANPTGGTTDWVSCQTVFWLKKGERPDLIKLNVVIEGGGTLWIKDIKLRKERLPLGIKLDAVDR